MQKVSVKDLLEAGVHFGHQTKRWNPKVKEFVYGQKDGIHIINLASTIHQLADACRFVYDVVSRGGSVLFVGTKRQAQQAVKDAADRTGMPYVSERWLGGTLTNNATIQKSIRKMLELDSKITNSESENLKKKEVSAMQRNSQRLHKNLDGIREMKGIPGAVVVVDICHDSIAVKEATRLKIPVVGIVDTNSNPEIVSFPVIANDDALKSIKILLDTMAEAIKIASDFNSKRVAEEKAQEEIRRKTEATEKPQDQKPAKEKSAPKKRSPSGGRRGEGSRGGDSRRSAPASRMKKASAPVKQEAPAKKEAAEKAEAKDAE